MPSPAGSLSLAVSPELTRNDFDGLRDFIRTHRVEEIECVTPDFAGIARGKVMPSAKFVREHGIKLPTSMFYGTINGDYADEGGVISYVDPDVSLVPDISTARAVPWTTDPSLQIIHDVVDRDGAPFPLSPRQVLARVCALYAEKGWAPVVAPELEFYLTKPNTDPDLPLEAPVGRSGRQSHGNQAFSLSAVDEYEPVIELIYDYAGAQNLEIDTIIQEAGAAQLEINTIHGHPMRLADEVFLFKRLIREAALRCNIYATFMAKPYESQPGSAMHIHMSVEDRDGRNIFSNPDGTASDFHDWFVGGQQRFFHDAIALAAPYVNSYRRLVPGWSAPINLDWAEDNRTTGLRSPQATPRARRVENRVVGADANPYLALAACLACGYLGMTQKVPPRSKLALETDGYRRARDLPYSLLEGIEALVRSNDLKAVLGAGFIDVYAAVKRTEYDQFMRVISPWEREHLLLNV